MSNSIKRFRYIEKDILDFLTIEKILWAFERNWVVQESPGPDFFGNIKSLSEKNGNMLFQVIIQTQIIFYTLFFIYFNCGRTFPFFQPEGNLPDVRNLFQGVCT